MEKKIIKTQRMVLRPWREDDLEPFAKMNADPRVREYFPAVLNRQESDQSVNGFREHFEQNGWGFWAVSISGVSEFVGFVGLQHVNFPALFTPNVEIGWRLAYEFWGMGLATEGAKAALDYGFKELKLNEIVAFTAVGNTRSRRVMEKLGMVRDPKDDFIHPKVPANSPVKDQVLYRLRSD